jgi:hypothetical protein
VLADLDAMAIVNARFLCWFTLEQGTTDLARCKPFLGKMTPWRNAKGRIEMIMLHEATVLIFDHSDFPW